jgi:hypothetical protein
MGTQPRRIAPWHWFLPISSYYVVAAIESFKISGSEHFKLHQGNTKRAPPLILWRGTTALVHMIHIYCSPLGAIPSLDQIMQTKSLKFWCSNLHIFVSNSTSKKAIRLKPSAASLFAGRNLMVEFQPYIVSPSRWTW